MTCCKSLIRAVSDQRLASERAEIDQIRNKIVRFGRKRRTNPILDAGIWRKRMKMRRENVKNRKRMKMWKETVKIGGK